MQYINVKYKTKKFKKIVFVLLAVKSSRAPGATGGTISNFLLIEQLAEAGFPVEVVCGDIAEVDELSLQAHGVRIITKEISTGLFKRLTKLIWFYSNIIKSDIDGNILVTSNGTSMFPVRNAQHKIICRAFEDFFVTNRKTNCIKNAWYSLMRWLTKKSYKKSESVITNSLFMKDYLSNKGYGTNIHVLYPPINQIYRKQGELVRRVEKIGIINPSHRKGEDIFLGLAGIFSGLKFIYFAHDAKNYSSHNICYGGWQSEIENIYSQIDLLIVPSSWEEPFGRVSPEAIRSGVPVLVSDRGGLPETVDAKLVVKDMTIEGWSNKLDWVIRNPEALWAAWARSYELSDRFSADAHQKSALEIFK